MTMKASNVSLLKLSQVSSRHLLRKSLQLEKRCFVTILNPSAPKVKRLQRSPGFEAQTSPVESEKISMLRKALEEANLEKCSVEAQDRYEGIPTIIDTDSNAVEDVEGDTGKFTGPGLDSALETEIITNPEKPEIESVALEDPENNANDEFLEEEIASPVTSSQEETDTKSEKVETDRLSIDIETTTTTLSKQKKKILTKKSAKATNATINTDPKQEEDSSSSDSDSSSSSSSSDSCSEAEDEEKKVAGSVRLTQVHFDLKPTLILQCLQFQEIFLDLAKLSHVKPHKPMIKFRKGRGAFEMQEQVKREPELEIDIQETASTALEWWEKPTKYYPEPLDETEIDQINSGGASRLYQ